MCVNNPKKLEQRVKKVFEYFFLGYGWKPFLLRMSVVIISLKLNSLESATNEVATGGMKLFLLTCAFLVYTFLMLIRDYTKRGIESEKRKRTNQQ